MGIRFLFVFLSFIFLSCQNKIKPYITAFLTKEIIEEDTTYYKEVYIYKEDGFATIPVAAINDTTLPITDFSYHWYLYSEKKKFAPGRKYKMVLTHDAGQAIGEIFFPNNFSIIKPEINFILPKNSDLSIIWQRAENATSYLVSVYLVYSYIDTNGNNISFRFSQDTIITDTFFTQPKEKLFPEDLRTINWGEGLINIWAINGIIIMPGAKENIKGMGQGFYYGANHSGERYLQIAHPGKRQLFLSPTIKKRLKEAFRQ
ncbi:MAG: hypothetical protein ABIK81_01320 [candidate division WOR-3 bacterium]